MQICLDYLRQFITWLQIKNQSERTNCITCYHARSKDFDDTDRVWCSLYGHPTNPSMAEDTCYGWKPFEKGYSFRKWIKAKISDLGHIFRRHDR